MQPVGLWHRAALLEYANSSATSSCKIFIEKNSSGITHVDLLGQIFDFHHVDLLELDKTVGKGASRCKYYIGRYAMTF